MEALLLERRILVMSSQMSALTIVLESITKLMYPFEWHHVYVLSHLVYSSFLLLTSCPFVMSLSSPLALCSKC